MIPIIDLLNKINWDKKENPLDYKIIYFDRVEEKPKTINFTSIKRIEKPFIIIDINNKETNIPLHRIREVKKEGKSIWKR